MAIEEFHRGSLRWILFMPGAQISFDEAVSRVPGNRDACPAQLIRYLERLSDGVKLHSPEHYRHEGDGIYAVKARCGLRAYGWYAHYKGQPAFVVSHFVLKKWDQFREEDRMRVQRHRHAFPDA